MRQRARLHLVVCPGLPALDYTVGATLSPIDPRHRPAGAVRTEALRTSVAAASVVPPGGRVQRHVPVRCGNGIADRTRGHSQGRVHIVREASVADSHAGALQGDQPGHHADRQHAPTVLPQALPLAHHLLHFGGPGGATLEPARARPRSARGEQVSIHTYLARIMKERITK